MMALQQVIKSYTVYILFALSALGFSVLFLSPTVRAATIADFVVDPTTLVESDYAKVHGSLSEPATQEVKYAMVLGDACGHIFYSGSQYPTSYGLHPTGNNRKQRAEWTRPAGHIDIAAKRIDGNKQTVPGYFSIYAVDDHVYTGDRSCDVTITTESTDQAFNGLTTSVTVSVLEDESAPDNAQPSAPSAKPSTPTQTSDSDVTDEEAGYPSPPEAKLVDSNGSEYKSGEERITYPYSEPIILSGTTIPNGEVKLYIFSEPREATVIADDNGNWSYTITGMEPGDHHVEAEVIDPVTGETSDRTTVALFAVEAETNGAEEDEVGASDSSNGNMQLYIGLAVLVALIAAGVYIWMKRRMSSSSNSPSKDVTENTAEEDPKVKQQELKK